MPHDALPEGASRPRPCGSECRRRFASWALVLLIGMVFRLVPVTTVWSARGARLTGDTDPHYHVLRAKRILEHYPRTPWFDAALSFPDGAMILWPPLFDHLIAGGAMLVGRGSPSPATIERVAAIIPVAIGVVTIPVVAALAAALFGGAPWLLAGLLLAMLPVHLMFSSIGRADQHVAELLLFCCVLLAFVASWRAQRRAMRWACSAALGVIIALAFWNWLGSALYFVPLVAFMAAWHALAPRGDALARRIESTIALGSAAGAAALAFSVWAWAPPGALRWMSLCGVTGFHALLTADVAAFAGLLWLTHRRPGPGRASGRVLEIAAAGSTSAALLLLLFPGARQPIVHGLTALAAANPWYVHIGEYHPLLRQQHHVTISDLRTPFMFLSVGPILTAASIPGLARRWRSDPAQRPGILLFAILCVVLVGLALLRVRFTLYAGLPMVLGCAWFARQSVSGLWRAAPWLLFSIQSTTMALSVAMGTPGNLSPMLSEAFVEMLEWLRGVPPPAPSHVGVMARWDLGHAIQYYAAKPVVVSPFGTDVGRAAMEDEGRFFFAASPATAETVLEKRRVGFLIVGNPLDEAEFSYGFAPPGTPEAVR